VALQIQLQVLRVLLVRGSSKVERNVVLKEAKLLDISSHNVLSAEEKPPEPFVIFFFVKMTM